MDYWNVVWLVVMLGFTIVAPLIVLVVAVRRLGAVALSEKQRSAGEKELREAGIVRAGEEWDAQDLDELMLNMRQYDRYQFAGVALTLLLMGGTGTVALVEAAGGLVNSAVYLAPALGIVAGAVMLGVGVGYVMSDRSFAAQMGTLSTPQPETIFSGASGDARRPWWLRWLDVGLVVAVSSCALLYALGNGGSLDDTSARLPVAHYPWLIWSIPVAACVVVATREVLVWWETHRPPLLLTEQLELAGRSDLYRRREVCNKVHESTPVPMLVLVQVMTFSSWALTSVEMPLLAVAIGTFVADGFAYMLAESRRTRLARSTGDAGLHGGSGA